MTNTSGTFAVPAGLVSVALYVPVVTAVAVMVRVKLKTVVPAGESEQGLPIVSLLTALPFHLHCMVGHGSAVTTANNVTCPSTMGATNSGFPMILSTVRLAEDEIDTAGFAKGKRVREHKCSVCIVCV